MHTGFWWGNPREGDHLEDPGVDGIIILKPIFEKWDGGMDWIDLTQNKDRLLAVVDAVIKLRVSKNAGNFLTSSKPRCHHILCGPFFVKTAIHNSGHFLTLRFTRRHSSTLQNSLPASTVSFLYISLRRF